MIDDLFDPTAHAPDLAPETFLDMPARTPATPAPDAPVETISTEAAEPPFSIGYTSGLWSGSPHHQCQRCAFDTFDQDVMRGHVQDHEAVERAEAELAALIKENAS